jgi:hypothetical protein
MPEYPIKFNPPLAYECPSCGERYRIGQWDGTPIKPPCLRGAALLDRDPCERAGKMLTIVDGKICEVL